MQQNLQEKTQIQAEKAKSCIKIENGKAIEHNRQNVFKSLTKPKN